MVSQNAILAWGIKMNKDIAILHQENLKNKIYTIRGVQVMLDRDLAEL